MLTHQWMNSRECMSEQFKKWLSWYDEAFITEQELYDRWDMLEFLAFSIRCKDL